MREKRRKLDRRKEIKEKNEKKLDRRKEIRKKRKTEEKIEK